MDDLRRMAIFAKVVETAAFNRAAAALGLTTSSVSQHVRGLEASLGVTLLRRSTRRLSLTEAGQVYYDECANVVHAAERGRQKIAVLRDEPAGELRIAAPSELAHLHLVPALQEFIRAHPALSVRIEVSDDKSDLIEQRIDLAIRIGELQDSRMVARQIAWFEELLCAAPQYLEKVGAPCSPESLSDLEWITFTPLGEPAFVGLRHDDGRQARVRLKGRLATNHAQTLRALVLGGHGAARLLGVDVWTDLAEGRLRPLLPSWHLPGFGVYAITPQRDAQPLKVSRCIDHLYVYFSRFSEKVLPSVGESTL
jgi:DNA-binding transcriptional LysR family regulator